MRCINSVSRTDGDQSKDLQKGEKMNAKAAMGAYKQLGLQSAVEGASPHQLIAMLLKGAIDKLAEAKRHLEHANYAEKGESVSRAIGIIEYLRASLEPGADPEFSTQMGELYSYMERRIFEANAQNDELGFVEVQGLLREVEEGWSAIPAEYRG